MVKIRDSTKPWSPFIHIDRRNSFTLDLRKQGLRVFYQKGEKMGLHKTVESLYLSIA